MRHHILRRVCEVSGSKIAHSDLSCWDGSWVPASTVWSILGDRALREVAQCYPSGPPLPLLENWLLLGIYYRRGAEYGANLPDIQDCERSRRTGRSAPGGRLAQNGCIRTTDGVVERAKGI